MDSEKAVTLHLGEKVVVGDVTVTLLDVRGTRVKVGLTCPRDVRVLRKELHDKLYGEGKEEAS